MSSGPLCKSYQSSPWSPNWSHHVVLSSAFPYVSPANHAGGAQNWPHHGGHLLP